MNYQEGGEGHVRNHFQDTRYRYRVVFLSDRIYNSYWIATESAPARGAPGDIVSMSCGSARFTGGAPGLQIRTARWEALDRRMVDTSVVHRVTGFTPLSLETYSKN